MEGGRGAGDEQGAAPNWARQQAFWNAKDLRVAVRDRRPGGSLRSWAAEALLNDADGYYGGFHNFYLYDQGQQGFVFLPQDTDATFDWLAVFDLTGATDHPVFWWEARAKPAPMPGQHWAIVMCDAGWRRKYADAMATLLGQWDVGADPGLDRRVVAADRRRRRGRPAQLGDGRQFQHGGRAGAREIVATRADYLRTFVDCEQNGNGRRPGRRRRALVRRLPRRRRRRFTSAPPRLCNGVDDNCNGTVDEGCQ